MENWCYEPEALALFATHYKTGEMIPMEYVQKIKESASFQEGLATMRQLSLDYRYGMARSRPNSNYRCKSFETEQFAATKLYPEVAENVSTALSYLSRWLFIRILQLQMGRSSGC
jgi:peptidyl-dipeptidase Dcp